MAGFHASLELDDSRAIVAAPLEGLEVETDAGSPFLFLNYALLADGRALVAREAEIFLVLAAIAGRGVGRRHGAEYYCRAERDMRRRMDISWNTILQSRVMEEDPRDFGCDGGLYSRTALRMSERNGAMSQ